METTIFKIGDQVFDIRYGWGEVAETCSSYINIDFINVSISFTDEHPDDIKLLSFTEYDLIAGGWSQDRSVLNQPKKGDLVYVRNHFDEEWLMKRIHHMNGSICYTGDQFDDSDKPQKWNYHSFENPLLKQ